MSRDILTSLASESREDSVDVDVSVCVRTEAERPGKKIDGYNETH